MSDKSTGPVVGHSAGWVMFQPKRVEPDFHPQVAPPAFVLALAERIYAAHEVIARRAERRVWDGTEHDTPMEG